MLFNSREFAVFFVAVFAAFWLLANRERARTLLLLGASYLFYGWWDWRFLGLIVFSTVLDYSVGRALGRTEDERARRRLLVASLVGNLGVLGFFKYWNFFTGEVGALLTALGLPATDAFLELVLPVGISFYTFQTLSYTIDVYRRSLAPEPSLARFAVFVAFFPQLVAGPIVRAKSFLPQLRRPPRLDAAALQSGLTLIFWGLVKKVVIADYLGRELVDPFWSRPETFGGTASLLAIYAYAFQIYGDFSGYSDIAIGAGRLLGFDLGRNFASPYRATSPREFWTRWHISLSTWLRDYLYIPLGGNRRGPWRTYRNLALTMLLGGLWHGASWMFVLWGAFHGALLIGDRLLGLREPGTALGRILRRAVFFQLTCLGWVFFRSPERADASAVLSSLAAPRGAAELAPYALLALGAAAATHFLPRGWKDAVQRSFTRLPGALQGAAYAAALGLVMNAESLARPFIYFQF